jgi:hypothetical protein
MGIILVPCTITVVIIVMPRARDMVELEPTTAPRALDLGR